MFAFILNHFDNRCLCLGFKDGSHAIHHGLNLWTIFDVKGDEVGSFDEFSDTPNTEAKKLILAYTANYSEKFGIINI